MNRLAEHFDSGLSERNIRVPHRGTRHLVEFAETNLKLIGARREPAVQIAQIVTAAADANVIRVDRSQRTRQDDSHAGVAWVGRIEVFAQERRLFLHQARKSTQQRRICQLGSGEIARRAVFRSQEVVDIQRFIVRLIRPCNHDPVGIN